MKRFEQGRRLWALAATTLQIAAGIVATVDLLNTSAVAKESLPPVVEIVTLVYSGRKNPVWKTSDPADFEDLRRFLDNLPPAAKPSWPVLGPRGYRLINHRVTGLPDEMRVFQGVIRVSEQGALRFFRDEHGMESWLRARTSPH